MVAHRHDTSCRGCVGDVASCDLALLKVQLGGEAEVTRTFFLCAHHACPIVRLQAAKTSDRKTFPSDKTLRQCVMKHFTVQRYMLRGVTVAVGIRANLF